MKEQNAMVIEEHRGSYRVFCEGRVYSAEVSGRYLYESENREDFPAVGDYVKIEPYSENECIIHEIHPRKNVLKRKAPGRETEMQIIAANLDLIFIVQGMDENYNLKRLERTLVLCRTVNAQTVILFNKKDLIHDDIMMERIRQAERIAPDSRIIPCSASSEEGLDQILQMLGEKKLCCLIGSSGAGKTSWINILTRGNAPVQETSFYSKGKHTTTSRQTYFLSDGSMLIDTPGMREFGLYESSEGFSETFADITELESKCRFKNCTHENEPGCAVQEALSEGELDEERYAHYLKLLKEEKYMESKISEKNALVKKNNDKKLAKMIRERLKDKGRK